MTYFLGPVSELNGTPNPRDRLLYRKINNEIPKEVNLGVTQFHITYFNTLAKEIPNPITSPEEIYTLQIDIKVENPAAYDNKYSNAFWRQMRLAARNVRNR
jgi:DMSO/TMAO reductase YedYZ molybdopterin-dependent catalytic subunit